MLLLKEYVGDISGKEALVIGRSLLFGKPAAQLLLAANATVTMAHSRSQRSAGAWRAAPIFWSPPSASRNSSRPTGSSPAPW